MPLRGAGMKAEAGARGSAAPTARWDVRTNVLTGTRDRAGATDLKAPGAQRSARVHVLGSRRRLPTAWKGLACPDKPGPCAVLRREKSQGRAALRKGRVSTARGREFGPRANKSTPVRAHARLKENLTDGLICARRKRVIQPDAPKPDISEIFSGLRQRSSPRARWVKPVEPRTQPRPIHAFRRQQ